MVLFLRVIGLMMRRMDMVRSCTLMGLNMMGSGKMAKKMAKVCTSGLMVPFIKETGRTVTCMVRALKRS